MNKEFAAAKGFGGTLKAIYKNAKDYPIEFIAEYIGVEGAQELVPLLIGGAAGVATKGLALAKGLGQEVAERIATKAAISSAGASDIAESVGGSAGDAFEDAYKTARDQGKSEAEATNIALNIATRVGLVAGVTTGLSLKLGGGALEDAILGKKATGEFAEIVDELGKRLNQGVKITIKEGVTEAGEEAVIGAAKESLMYSLDPTRDVAKNITLSAAMGGIAGGAIAGTTYGAYTTGDVVSNILLANPTVSNTITDSANAAAADKALANLGITDSKIKANILNSKYDADYTSQAEAKAALTKVPGYTFTQSEVDQFVGPTKNADLTNAVEAYVDPRFVDRDEVIAAAKAENVTLTEEQITNLVGQKDEASTIAAARKEFNPLGTTYDEARAFFRDVYGYTPTANEVNLFVKNNFAEDQAKTDIGLYVDPRQVTIEEAREFYKELGYTPTEAELKKFVGQVDEAQQKTKLIEYVDPRMVDADEVRSAYETLGLKKPTEADIQELVGQYMETDLPGKAETYLPTARYNSIIDQLESLGIGASKEVLDAIDIVKSDFETQITDLGYKIDENTGILTDAISQSESNILAKVAEYEAAGIDRDTALNKAIEDVSTELGVTKTELLDRIGTTEANLKAEIEKTRTDLSGDIGEVGTALTEVEANLIERMGEYEAAGISRDEALQKSVEDLGITLSDVEINLLDRMGEYEAAGIERDEALQLAIADTETRLAGDIETAKTELSTDIQTVADLVGKPYRDVTQTDIDFVNNLITQQETDTTTQLTPEQLAYDTNKDGVIDRRDLAFLQNVVRGTNEQPFVPPPESIWTQEPTGIYGTLYEQEQAAIARSTAQKAEAARLAKITQQKGNVNTLLQMLGQAPDVGGQQVTVKAPDPLQLGYVYDIAGPSIFATPQQQQMFVTPYTPFAQGGAVEDDVTDALLRILRG